MATEAAKGETDPQRLAFFAAWIDQQDTYDIDTDDLLSAVVVLRDLRTWIEDNLSTLAKMRR